MKADMVDVIKRRGFSLSFVASCDGQRFVLKVAKILGLILGLIRGTQGPAMSLCPLKGGIQGQTG